ncbi:hypothetical protein JMJ77_0009192 [Colletotrichum scovillei]|uniref:Uncharacterized protein n=1 Tax=Colletotrichum scovillei TaxID=1209932 RepID=A0A9P7QYV0_9PEZI|nr:hypothetical protein JMJ77_0009192 [Colletotrichum scovillei]KAG7052267.1 hypothetical protein JMJ78_0005288 [Colletotrichum scovillei]KAG7064558.1 hypothetical protein JMJ76_0012321 [Colletotrichum scovillei]
MALTLHNPSLQAPGHLYTEPPSTSLTRSSHSSPCSPSESTLLTTLRPDL